VHEQFKRAQKEGKIKEVFVEEVPAYCDITF
jgi:hypothetical protein